MKTSKSLMQAMGWEFSEPSKQSLDSILTKLENEVARDVQLRLTQHRSGRSPKSSHAEAKQAIVEAVEGLAKKNVTMLVPGIGKVIELDSFLQAIKEWQQ